MCSTFSLIKIANLFLFLSVAFLSVQPLHVLGQARLNNSEFATVALCAVEHPKFKPTLIRKMLVNVSINDLLTANEAGAKAGAKAWRLITGAMAEDCGEKDGKSLGGFVTLFCFEEMDNSV